MTALHEAHGAVMKEFVTVPAALLADTEQLAPWFTASGAYSGTLKSKSTTKKK
jgi:hypothetical protein